MNEPGVVNPIEENPIVPPMLGPPNAPEELVPEKPALTDEILLPPEIPPTEVVIESAFERSDELVKIGKLRKFGSYIMHLPGRAVDYVKDSKEAFKENPWQFTKHAVEGAIVGLEFSPLGVALRYGGFAAIFAATKNVPLSAAYLGGSTFATEEAGAVAMSNILDRDQNRLISKMNTMANKFFKRDKKMSLVAQVAIANYLGTPALLATKKREDPEISKEVLRRHGLISSTILAGVMALQGVALAEGAVDPSNPKIIIPGIAVLGGISWLKRRLNKKAINDKEATVANKNQVENEDSVEDTGAETKITEKEPSELEHNQSLGLDPGAAA